MNISELKTRLNELGIEEYEYNLGDKSLSELELGILKGEGTWKVYQSLERGGMNIIDIFENENDACELILKYLIMRKD
ncbi:MULTISPECIES: hypothetical protein [Bacillus cereus group]|uniref:hypothetical protein n=1 Tax=Bacillus cereus group TaxID=86661 RepID=UPI00065BBCAC|nr:MULTISPECIES: hypothetical protein [Bacillus cereus group]KMQ17001.1 hypothetical protein TU70_14440 [Bacillus mycoides]QWI41403.1 hypothetical protein EXW43_31025 [Bacillus mycoides]SFQ90940.1 hypothetical protein SAMN04487920_12523 [Bacillus mycoides]